MLTREVPKKFLLEDMQELKLNVVYQVYKNLVIFYDREKVKDYKKEISHIEENKFIAYCEETKEHFYIETRYEASEEEKNEYIQGCKKITWEEAKEIKEELKKELNKKEFKYLASVQSINLDRDIIKTLKFNKTFEKSRRIVEYITYYNMDLSIEIELKLI